MKNTWLFPALESVHLMGLALALGTIVLVDLHRLGWIPAPDSANLDLWTWRGLAVMFTTGPAMFLADRSRYLHNSAFVAKMVLLAAALTLHFALRRRGRRWATALSLGLWAAVVVAARLIADFDLP